MTAPARRLLVVEDDPRFVAAAKALVDPARWSVTWVNTAADALAAAETPPRPELVLVDLGLPDLDGVALIARLTTASPDVPVLVLSGATSHARVTAALKAGACGYIYKEDVGSRLGPALEEAYGGGAPMSADAARYVLEQFRSLAPASDTAESDLTTREREVVTLLAKGLKYEEIADQLGVSINTVRTHIRATYDKLHATNKAQAILAARREGWLRD